MGLRRRAAEATPNILLRGARGRKSREAVANELCRIAADKGEPSVGYNGNQVYRWEAGLQTPRTLAIECLTQYYNTTAAELGLPDPAAPDHPNGYPSAPAPSTLSVARHRPNDQMIPLPELAAVLSSVGVPDLQRRTVLRVLTTLGSAGAVTNLEPWERLSYALSRPAAVDPATVDELERSTATFYGLEEILPARRLYQGLAAHLDTVARLLDQPPASDALHRRLTVTAGEAAALTGWLAWDLGRNADALRLYALARQAAADVDDKALTACALAYESYLAAAEHNPQRARELLQTARQQISPASYPATAAWLAGREAEEAGTLGLHADTLTAIDHAMTTWTNAAPGERMWTGFLNDARLGAMEVSAHVRRREPAAADAAANRVLAELPPSEVKTRSIILADVATAYAQGGHVEDACGLAGEALALGSQTETSVGLQHLHQLREQLTPWRTAQPVRELYEQLTAAGV